MKLFAVWQVGPQVFDFDEMCHIYYLACSFFRCLQHLNFCCFSLRYFFKSTIIFFLCCVHWIWLDLVICFSFFVWSCSIYHETVSVAIEQNHTLSLLLSKTEQYSACSPCQWMIIDIAPEGWHPMSFFILGEKKQSWYIREAEEAGKWYSPHFYFGCNI